MIRAAVRVFTEHLLGARHWDAAGAQGPCPEAGAGELALVEEAKNRFASK